MKGAKVNNFVNQFALEDYQKWFLALKILDNKFIAKLKVVSYAYFGILDIVYLKFLSCKWTKTSCGNL